MLADLRAIDVCALYGGADTIAGHRLTVVGPTSVHSCDGHVAAPAGDVKVTVALNVGSSGVQQHEDRVKHHIIDGVDVRSVSAWDAPEASSGERIEQGSCQYVAALPNEVVLMVMARSSSEEDTCAVADAAVRTAIRAYASRPARTPNRFPTTVLTGADPCAALERLRAGHRVEVDASGSTIDTCAFTVDGSPTLTTSLSYQDPSLLQYSTDRFDVDGHQVAGDASRGSFDVVVGPQFQLDGNALVPVVTVDDSTSDTDRIRLVIDAVVDEY
ncbi:hypothetical protein LV457_14895 [Mycobacterium sp. MYCO198283]|uniref:hypothetical protein n=1 Tax=Mycobacterium sp. MYCO198283 TaxID=2883505 RepID=UPI001E52A2E3|nr:hypothetical protein [Mycobacterium sp. MYCO198283]MCG5433565.1 hypothetical protein [Mycobacterium sp. MYCO198283]